MPFKRMSRNSSRNQSSESLVEGTDRGIDEVTERTQQSNQEDNIQLNLTDNEIFSIMNNAESNNEISDTLRNPLGKFLAKLTDSYNKHLDRDEEPIQLEDFCQAFQAGMKLNKVELNEAIETSTQKFKDNLYKNELNFHLINPLITPPRKYGVHPTLKTVSRNVDAAKLFPQNKSRFSGVPGEVPISEFIFNLNAAQEKMILSEIEFKEKLLSSTTGEAHNFIRTQIQEGDDVETIYYKLLCLYDDSPQPSAAKQELLRFKISRRSNLMKAQGKILELASCAARIFPDGPLRKTFLNNEACQSLIRALPEKSSQIVATQYNILIGKKAQTSQEPPLFVDLIRFLGSWRTEIDRDIQYNGANYDDRNSRAIEFNRSSRVNDYNRSSYRPYKRAQVNTVQANRGRSFGPAYKRNYLGIREIKGTVIENKYMNKLYCSLCGSNTHTAAMGCYAMKRNGRVVPVTPTQIACAECENKLHKKLYHPPAFCFTKNKPQRGGFNKNKGPFQGRPRA